MAMNTTRRVGPDGRGIAIGVALGTAFGLVFHQMALGIALGTAFGAMIDLLTHLGTRRK